MKTQNFALVLGLTGLAVLLQTNKASALDFSFSYTANGVTTQGILNTTTTSTSGQYLITGITNGTRGSTSISYVSVNTYAYNDNLLTPNASDCNKLTYGGFDYSANGVIYTIFDNTTSYGEINNIDNPSGNATPNFSFTTLNVSQVQVPFDFNPTQGLVLGLGLSTGLGICKKKLARKSTII